MIPGAKVRATNLANGFTYPSTTNSAGLYTILNPPPSGYSISVDAQGFQRSVRSGIALVVSQHATVNVQMNVGATTQSVTVSAAPPLLQAQDATTGQTVGRTLIQDLPLVGRSMFGPRLPGPRVEPAAHLHVWPKQ